jgi:hypothetical protein
MAFGLSPSDIILFLKFTSTVVGALREHGGARREFQDAIQSCEALQKILKELGEIRFASSDLVIPDDYQNYTSHFSNAISLFKTQLDSYSSTLGQTPHKWRPLRHSRHKVQWALKAAKDLEQFRKSIAPHVENLELLLLRRSL